MQKKKTVAQFQQRKANITISIASSNKTVFLEMYRDNEYKYMKWNEMSGHLLKFVYIYLYECSKRRSYTRIETTFFM